MLFVVSTSMYIFLYYLNTKKTHSGSVKIYLNKYKFGKDNEQLLLDNSSQAQTAESQMSDVDVEGAILLNQEICLCQTSVDSRI